MGRTEAPAPGESRRPTATPHPYGYRASALLYPLFGSPEQRASTMRILVVGAGAVGGCLVAAWFTQTATSPFLFTCHDKVFYRACDAASSIRAATSFGLET